jgi:signal transduction histidine kinase/CheY-like chemotaxis protein
MLMLEFAPEFVSVFLNWQIFFILLANLVGAALICAFIMRHKQAVRLSTHLNAKNEQLRDRLFRNAEQLELYRSLVEDQGDIIIRRDLNNRIIYANDAFTKLVLSLPNAPLKIIEEPFELSGETTKIIPASPQQPLSYEQRIETNAGIRWIAFIEAPMRDDETGVIFYQLVGRDVTDRRLAEAASEAKSRFLATVSHEIRTPLNGVLGMAQLLQNTKINAEQKTYINAISTSGEALLSLIEQILDFSRIESGKFEIVNEPFDLWALCESVIELLAPRAQGKGIEIALHITKTVPKIVIGDAARLRQILTNLCGNAVKFTINGGVGVRVKADINGKIEFHVEDTGIGIAKDRLKHIFEEFEQGDGSHSFEGTGLGLAISQKIIDQLGGSIDVKSKLKKGSHFTLYLDLPMCKTEKQNVSPVIASSRVLIVGKTPFEATFIADKLNEYGFTTILRSTPELALADISSCKDKGLHHRIDALIIDAALGSSSRALANLARASGIKTRIILLSPFEKNDFLKKQDLGVSLDLNLPVEAGFNAWLTKPVRTRSLLERLSGQLSELHVSTVSYSGLDKTHKPLKGQHILVAEDNEINALLVERQLSKAGANVIVARDGREAVTIYEQRIHGTEPKFNLILLDMRMPELDGLATLRRMMSLTQLEQVPRFIALTANAFAEDKTICLNAGFDAFLTKPLDFHVLVNTLADMSIKTPNSKSQTM